MKRKAETTVSKSHVCEDWTKCQMCHADHEVPDHRCEFCIKFVEEKVSAGKWCAVKPWEHYDFHMVGYLNPNRGMEMEFEKPPRCLECEFDQISLKNPENVDSGSERPGI